MLQEHEAVKDAIVLALEDVPGERYLAAYIVAREGHAADMAQLRAFLKPRLPSYMVPAAFLPLTALPLNVNGKVNLKVLPKPDGNVAGVAGDYVAARTPLEQQLVEIWETVLKRQSIGIHDNFFELGGHSLIATRVIARINEALQVDLPLRRLFEAPTIAELAPVVVALAGTGVQASGWPPLSVALERHGLPLSAGQRRLWFLDKMEGAGRAYQVHFGLRLQGRLDVPALQRALDHIVVRHEVLRTVFSSRDGEPLQRILPAEDSALPLLRQALEQGQDVQQAIARACDTGFDLAEGPLIRAHLLTLAEDEHALLLVMHHIVADAWSFGLLGGELATLYADFHTGQAPSLAPLPVQYADYALWQQKWLSGALLERQLSYWTGRLAGAPPQLLLPTDRPRPAVQDFSGAAIDLEIDAQLTAGLRRLAQAHGLTLYMTVLAAWALTLQRMSGQRELLIGTPAINRPLREVEELIGLFINMLPMRLDFGTPLSVAQLLAQVRTAFLEAHEHQHLPFEQMVKAARPVRSTAYSPVFQVMFAWQNAGTGELMLPGLRVQGLGMGASRSAKYDLSLVIEERANHLSGNLEFASALFERASVERFIAYFRQILRAMVADAQQSAAALPLLSLDEAESVQNHGIDAGEAAQPFQALPEQVLVQAGRTPGRTAVLKDGHSLSYAVFAGQARALAGRLRALGVREEQRVAVCLETGPELALALLAVLMAGGVCVPLAPSLPEASLQRLLVDSRPLLVVAAPGWRRRSDLTIPVFELEDGAQQENGLAAAWEGGPLRPADGACLIYPDTGASEAAGLLLPHAALAELFAAGRAAFSAELRGHAAAAAPCGSLLSWFECLAPLTRGGTVHFAAQQGDLANAPATLVCAEVAGLADLLDSAALPAAARVLGVFGVPLPDDMLARVFNATGIETVWQLHGGAACALTTASSRHRSAGGTARAWPHEGVRLYLLDPAGQQVPVGVVGELYAGGAVLARGYHGRAALTAARFLPDPFSGEAGARLYRTGLRCRRLADGAIEYLLSTGTDQAQEDER
ncbi:condensation domain-containing protein [Massilia sp. MB5]|uniref:condensation domain-containing protein n=1 Tax=Massilia sp. MB5 TaxID=2919578 RepID=UPI001F0E24A3|nr:condensation domain-containing protein [Massilia sp. MB5]UMR29538.1 condensation domain-containing protein [Massilia sp. MB5]